MFLYKNSGYPDKPQGLFRLFVDVFMKLTPQVSALYAREEIVKAVGARGDESCQTHTNSETLW